MNGVIAAKLRIWQLEMFRIWLLGITFNDYWSSKNGFQENQSGSPLLQNP